MKKKYLFYILYFLVFVFCTKNHEEDLFAKSPVERINETMSELQKELVSSSDGWRLSYFPNEKKYGGFTFLMKFDQNGRVKMVSDFDQTTTSEKESSYSIKHGQGVLLSFVTKNHIHNLSDAVLGQQGKGFEGEFEFIYLGKEDDKLKFRTQRKETIIYLEKATLNQWENINLLYTESLRLQKDSYRYRAKLTSANGVKNYILKGSEFRHLTLENQDDNTEKYHFGIIPITEGFVISPSIKLAGKTFERLKLEGTKYTATIDGVSLDIDFVEYPALSTSDFQEVLKKHSGFVLYVPHMLNSFLLSDKFRKFLITEDSRELFAVRIYLDDGYCDLEVLNDFGTGVSLMRHFASYQIKDNKIYFKPLVGQYVSSNQKVWESPENEPILIRAMEIFNFLTHEKNSFYIEKRSENLGLENPVFVLQSSQWGDIYFPVYGVL